ncbi:MAG: DUF488 domain-containing protein [Candidatus Saccharibacteria bacterium]
MPSINIKRVYESASPDDGMRILVDRLWPRGLSKEGARLDMWMKEIAPSDRLRQWFKHDPKKWPEFRRRYSQEALKNPALDDLRSLVKKKKITLLYAASDETRNNAQVLKDILET